MKKSDLWETPLDLFNDLHKEFSFDIDLCSNGSNNKVSRYCTEYFALEPGSFKCGFMNPPYSCPKAFIEKAYDDSLHSTIVALIKCDTSTQTWAVIWDYETGQPKPGVTVRFLPKRLKFNHPDVYKPMTAPFPSAIIIMNRQNL